MSVEEMVRPMVSVSYEGGRYYVLMFENGQRRRLPCRTRPEAERLAAKESARLAS